MTSAHSTPTFAPTRWTLVLRATGDTPEATAALSELCEAYYQPVFRFLRREGLGDDDARELAQGFFAKLLGRGDLAADPRKGRFRSYLLGAVKHFLADRRKHQARAKRGGGSTPESLDDTNDDGRSPQVPNPPGAGVDSYFDRQWALTVMERSLDNLRTEFANAGKTDQFERLKPWLVGETENLSQAKAAAGLGWTETAIKVAIHRLRKRFREMVRGEISQTVAEGTDVDGEIRYLIEVLTANRDDSRF